MTEMTEMAQQRAHPCATYRIMERAWNSAVAVLFMLGRTLRREVGNGFQQGLELVTAE